MRLTISACLSTINLLSAAHIMSCILLLHDSPPSFPSIVSSQHPPKTSTTRGREGGREGGREKIAAMPLCATIGASVMRFLNSICIICNRVERQSRVGFLPSSSSSNNHTEMHRGSWRFTWHPITRTSSWMGIPATFPLPPPLALDMAAMASALSASLISSSPSSALTTGGLFWWFDSRWGRGRKARERTGAEYLVVGMEMRVAPTSLVGNACGTHSKQPHTWPWCDLAIIVSFQIRLSAKITSNHLAMARSAPSWWLVPLAVVLACAGTSRALCVAGSAPVCRYHPPAQPGHIPPYFFLQDPRLSPIASTILGPRLLPPLTVPPAASVRSSQSSRISGRTTCSKASSRSKSRPSSPRSPPAQESPTPACACLGNQSPDRCPLPAWIGAVHRRLPNSQPLAIFPSP